MPFYTIHFLSIGFTFLAVAGVECCLHPLSGFHLFFVSTTSPPSSIKRYQFRQVSALLAASAQRTRWPLTLPESRGKRFRLRRPPTWFFFRVSTCKKTGDFVVFTFFFRFPPQTDYNAEWRTGGRQTIRNSRADRIELADNGQTAPPGLIHSVVCCYPLCSLWLRVCVCVWELWLHLFVSVGGSDGPELRTSWDTETDCQLINGRSPWLCIWFVFFNLFLVVHFSFPPNFVWTHFSGRRPLRNSECRKTHESGDSFSPQFSSFKCYHCY